MFQRSTEQLKHTSAPTQRTNLRSLHEHSVVEQVQRDRRAVLGRLAEFQLEHQLLAADVFLDLGVFSEQDLALALQLFRVAVGRKLLGAGKRLHDLLQLRVLVVRQNLAFLQQLLDQHVVPGREGDGGDDGDDGRSREERGVCIFKSHSNANSKPNSNVIGIDKCMRIECFGWN